MQLLLLRTLFFNMRRCIRQGDRTHSHIIGNLSKGLHDRFLFCSHFDDVACKFVCGVAWMAWYQSSPKQVFTIPGLPCGQHRSNTRSFQNVCFFSSSSSSLSLSCKRIENVYSDCLLVSLNLFTQCTLRLFICGRCICNKINNDGAMHAQTLQWDCNFMPTYVAVPLQDFT